MVRTLNELHRVMLLELIFTIIFVQLLVVVYMCISLT